jgi:hypothetical protein
MRAQSGEVQAPSCAELSKHAINSSKGMADSAPEYLGTSEIKDKFLCIVGTSLNNRSLSLAISVLASAT